MNLSTTPPAPAPIIPSVLNKMVYLPKSAILTERTINFDTIIINYQNIVPNNITAESIFVLLFFRTGGCLGN